jgi:hypothetical protein
MDPSVFFYSWHQFRRFFSQHQCIMLPSTAIAVVIPLSNTQQVINLKLTNSNYLFWCMQIKPYLIGQGVFLFVDGSHSCPSPLDMSSHSTTASTNINCGPSEAFHI